MEKKCIFCNSDANVENDAGNYTITCNVCGNYILSIDFANKDIFHNKYSSYLVHNKTNSIPFIGKDEINFKNYKEYKALQTDKRYKFITEEDIDIFYPKTFSERINKILIWFKNNSKQYGIFYDVDYRKLVSVFFINRFDEDGLLFTGQEIPDQYASIKEYLSLTKHYVEFKKPYDSLQFMLTAAGYEQLEKINADKNDNKKVFVAMAFNDDTKNTREAIRKGIHEAKYDPLFMDEVIHNKQIVPEMFRLIQECIFLVMDISEPNYGAYLEAGYALGLGKEVIITCSKEIFDKKYETEEEKKFEKYLKPHFDIAQKQILKWKNEEDLTKQLSEWIKAIE